DVPEASLFPPPARLSFEEAATLPVAGLTAFRALFTVGGVGDGDTVLVLCAGSGVSTFAVQLAAQEGARVLVTSSSEEKIERAKELGAARGVLYTEEAPPESLSPAGLVLDPLRSTWRDSARALPPGGPLVRFGGTAG